MFKTVFKQKECHINEVVGVLRETLGDIDVYDIDDFEVIKTNENKCIVIMKCKEYGY